MQTKTNYTIGMLTPVRLLYGFWFSMSKIKRKSAEKKPAILCSCFPSRCCFFSLHEKTNALTIFQRFASNPDQSGTCVFLCVTMDILKTFFSQTIDDESPSDNTFYYTFLNIDSAMINTLTLKERIWCGSPSLSLFPFHISSVF